MDNTISNSANNTFDVNNIKVGDLFYKLCTDMDNKYNVTVYRYLGKLHKVLWHINREDWNYVDDDTLKKFNLESLGVYHKFVNEYEEKNTFEYVADKDLNDYINNSGFKYVDLSKASEYTSDIKNNIKEGDLFYYVDWDYITDKNSSIYMYKYRGKVHKAQYTLAEGANSCFMDEEDFKKFKDVMRDLGIYHDFMVTHGEQKYPEFVPDADLEDYIIKSGLKYIGNPTEYPAEINSNIEKTISTALDNDEYNQSAKYDKGKLQISLVPTQIIKDIALVRMYGTQKYKDPNNWKKVEKQRYIDAMMRHILAFLDDEDSVDEESGIPHYMHAACNMAFIAELKKKDKK